MSLGEKNRRVLLMYQHRVLLFGQIRSVRKGRLHGKSTRPVKDVVPFDGCIFVEVPSSEGKIFG
jgi:hypothetical protein